MLLEMYSLSCLAESEINIFSGFAKKEPWISLKPGTYNDGLFTILDSGTEISFMSSWAWLCGLSIYPIAVTGWGDCIYSDSKEKKLFFLFSKNFHKVSMGNTFSSVFDKNFCTSEFREKILRVKEFEDLVNLEGPLSYGECFEEGKSGVRKKNVFTYLNVTGQTGQQLYGNG